MAKYQNEVNYKITTTFDKTGITQLQAQLAKLETEMRAKASTNSLYSTRNSKQDLANIKAVQHAINSSFNGASGLLNTNKFSQSLLKSKTDINSVAQSFNRFGLEGQKAMNSLIGQLGSYQKGLRQTTTLTEKLGQTIGNTVRWGIVAGAFQEVMSAASQAVQYVKELDESLTQITMVSGESRDAMKEFAEYANKAAAALGSSTTDMTNATKIFIQEGFSLEQSKQQAIQATILGNVSEQDTATTADQITAYRNAFGISIEEMNTSLDKIASLANNTASNVNELMTATQRAASTAASVGASEDTFLASIATIQSITRESAEQIGNGLKSIYTRFGDVRTGETLEDGLDVGKYGATLRSAGVDILDANGQYKGMDQILSELQQVWSTLNEGQRLAVGETVAGRFQYNRFAALMNNQHYYDQAMGAIKNSSGTMDKMQEAYMEGLEAKMQKMATNLEALFTSIYNSGLVEDVVDGFVKLSDVFADIFDNIDGGIPILSGLVAILGKLFGKQMATGITNMMANADARKTETQRQQYRQYQLTQRFNNENLTAGQSEFIKMASGAAKFENLYTAEEKEKLAQIEKEYIDLLQRDADRVEKLNAVSKEYFETLKPGISLNEQLREETRLVGEAIAYLTDVQNGEAELYSMSAEKISQLINVYGGLGGAATKLSNTYEKISALQKENNGLITKDMEGYQELTGALTEFDARLANLISTEDLDERTKQKLLIMQKEVGDAWTTEGIDLEKLNGSISECVQSYDRLIRELEKNIESGNLNDKELRRQIKLLEGVKAAAAGDTGALKVLGKEYESLTGKTMKTRAAISNFTTALGNVSMQVMNVTMLTSAFKELSTVLNDDSLTTGEKLEQVGNSFAMILMSVSMIAPGIIKTYKGLTEASKAYNGVLLQSENLQKVLKMRLDENTAAKIRNILSTDGLTKAEKEEELQTIKGIGKKRAAILVELASSKVKAKGLFIRMAEIFGIELETLTVEQLNWAYLRHIALQKALHALKMAGPWLAVAAAIGVCVAAYKISTKSLHDNKDAYDKTTEAADRLADAAKNVATELEEFDSKIDSIKDHKKDLDQMRKGTEEWAKATRELNLETMNLLQAYPELAKYTRNINGILTISDEGIKQMDDAINQRQIDAANAQMALSYDAMEQKNGTVYERAARDYGTDWYSSSEGAVAIGGTSVGLIAGAIAAALLAPETGGLSLAAYVAYAGAAGIAAGGAAGGAYSAFKNQEAEARMTENLERLSTELELVQKGTVSSSKYEQDIADMAEELGMTTDALSDLVEEVNANSEAVSENTVALLGGDGQIYNYDDDYIASIGATQNAAFWTSLQQGMHGGEWNDDVFMENDMFKQMVADMLGVRVDQIINFDESSNGGLKVNIQGEDAAKMLFGDASSLRQAFDYYVGSHQTITASDELTAKIQGREDFNSGSLLTLDQINDYLGDYTNEQIQAVVEYLDTTSDFSEYIKNGRIDTDSLKKALNDTAELYSEIGLSTEEINKKIKDIIYNTLQQSGYTGEFNYSEYYDFKTLGAREAGQQRITSLSLQSVQQEFANSGVYFDSDSMTFDENGNFKNLSEERQKYLRGLAEEWHSLSQEEREAINTEAEWAAEQERNTANQREYNDLLRGYQDILSKIDGTNLDVFWKEDEVENLKQYLNAAENSELKGTLYSNMNEQQRSAASVLQDVRRELSNNLGVSESSINTQVLVDLTSTEEGQDALLRAANGDENAIKYIQWQLTDAFASDNIGEAWAATIDEIWGSWDDLHNNWTPLEVIDEDGIAHQVNSIQSAIGALDALSFDINGNVDVNADYQKIMMGLLGCVAAGKISLEQLENLLRLAGYGFSSGRTKGVGLASAGWGDWYWYTGDDGKQYLYDAATGEIQNSSHERIGTGTWTDDGISGNGIGSMYWMSDVTRTQDQAANNDDTDTIPPETPADTSPSGSGSSSSAKQVEADVQKNIDIYEEVNEQLERLSAQFDKINSYADRLTGQDRINRLQKTIDVEKKNLEVARAKLLINQNELNTLRNSDKDVNDNKTIGAFLGDEAFNDDGSIKYDAYYNKYMELWNKAMSYNGSTDEEGYKAAQDELKAFEEAVDSWNEALNLRDELVQQLDDSIYKIQDQNKAIVDEMKNTQQKLQDLNETMNAINDTGDWFVNGGPGKIWTTELKAAQDDFDQFMTEENTDMFGNQTIGRVQLAGNNMQYWQQQQAMYDELVKPFEQAMHDITENPMATGDEINAAIADYEAAKANAGELGLRDLSASQFEEEVQSSLEDYKSALEEGKNRDEALYSAVQGFWDTVDGQFDRLQDGLKDVVDDLSTAMSMTTMLYGEKAYDKQNALLQQQNDTLYQQSSNIAEMIAKQQERIVDAAAKYGTDSEAYQKAQDRMADLQNQQRDTMVEIAQTTQKIYQNLVNDTTDKWANNILFGEDSGMDLDWYEEQWSLITRNADQYYDDVNRAYEIQKLQGDYLDTLNNASGLDIQRKISAQMAQQLDYLRTKTNLSKYDVEYARAQLEILQKQIALEDAQANKTKMKLRRDSQGNYSYVYTADEENINAAEGDLAEAQNNAYNLSKDAMITTQEQAINAVKDAKQKLVEVMNDASLSEEERAERMQFIVDNLKEYLSGASEDIGNIANNLLADVQNMAAVLLEENSGNLQNIVAEIVAGNNDAWDLIDERLNTSVTNSLQNYEYIEQETDELVNALLDYALDYEEGLEGALDTVESTMDSYVDDVLYNAIDATAELIDATNEFFDTLDARSESAFSASSAVSDYTKNLETLTEYYRGILHEKGYDENGNPLNQGGSGSGGAQGKVPDGVNATDLAYQIANAIWRYGDYGNGSDRLGKIKSKYGEDMYKEVQKLFNSGYGYNWTKYDLGFARFDTGGYTGTWNGGIDDTNGRMAILHQKELVLNANDTENLLKAVEVLNQMPDIASMSDLQINKIGQNAATDVIEQRVQIDATFPAAEDASEIKRALESLADNAYQLVNRR